MLDEMIKWVDEAPALAQSNQRFGNLAFRTYYKLIEKVSPPAAVSTSN
jgi:serine/threonine-protein phosphatase 2A activator